GPARAPADPGRHRAAVAGPAAPGLGAGPRRRARRLALRARGARSLSRGGLRSRVAAAVFRERGPRLACFGYFGHMWELYAMWTWLGLFPGASLEARGAGSYLGLSSTVATFAAMGVGGALGAYAVGALADRWGRTTLTMAPMELSGLSGAL